MSQSDVLEIANRVFVQSILKLRKASSPAEVLPIVLADILPQIVVTIEELKRKLPGANKKQLAIDVLDHILSQLKICELHDLGTEVLLQTIDQTVALFNNVSKVFRKTTKKCMRLC